MKKTFLFLSLFIFVAMACDLTVTVAPSTSPAPLSTNTVVAATGAPTQISATVTSIPATAAINVTPIQIPASVTPVPTTVVINATPAQFPATVAPTAQPPSPVGVEVAVDPLSVVLPPGLTYGARGIQIPRAVGQNVAPLNVTPGHIQLKLEGYLLQEKAHQPQIYVYPAQSYAELVPGAFENIHRLNNILYDPSAPISADQLPTVPFFNAKQVFASNIQVMSFQNGRGVRFLTEYAQYPVSANNHDLFYHFQGVTSDGAYYIIAILPISNPNLAETSDAGAVLPLAGILYPYFANPNADMSGYYRAVTSLLNATPPETFAPMLNQLDALIQSMRIAP